jgi:hypothetical protein
MSGRAVSFSILKQEVREAEGRRQEGVFSREKIIIIKKKPPPLSPHPTHSLPFLIFSRL